MNINDNLFKLLKNNKFKEFIELLKSRENIDCNIRDGNNNYLIQYAILNNNIEIVQMLIQKGSKLDFIDFDGRNILFIPIKFGYENLLKILLEKDKSNIGISLLEISDLKGIFPLHYSIIFKNYNAVELILKYINNIDQPDREGNTALHYSIKIKDFKIFNMILNNSPDINYQTKDGETPLHIACNFTQINIVEKLLEKPELNLNLQDYQNQITPLMYSLILENNKLFDLLYKKSDIDIQDINGNNSLHFAINENNTNSIDKLLNKYDNLYTSNLLGKSPLHLLLESIKLKNYDINNYNIKLFIEKSNINIQDYNGNSCFFLLVKDNYWKKYIDVLDKKKINAFLKNHEDKTPFDFVKEENKDLFFNLLTTSYINIIRKSNIVWKNEIDNECKNNLSYKKFLTIKDKYNFNENIVKKWDKDMCPAIIRSNIKNFKISYPVKLKNYCIELEYKKGSTFVSYTGITLDILIGLLLLHKNFNASFSSSLTLNFKNNENLKSHYITYEDRLVSNDELLNFEVIWNNQIIFFPESIDEIIEKFNSNKNKRFLCLPIGIELSQDSHANIILYDKKLNELERFEPNGATFPFKYNYNPDLLDKLIEDKMSTYFPNLKYFKPIDYLPKIGFQLFEAYDHYRTKKIGDPGGFCAVWCVWYIYMRLKYFDLDRKKLCIKLVTKIKEENIPFKDLIRSFASKIVFERDSLLEGVNLDIDSWINGNFSNSKLEKLILLIQQQIKEYN